MTNDFECIAAGMSSFGTALTNGELTDLGNVMKGRPLRSKTTDIMGIVL